MMSSMNHIADVSLKGTLNACQSEIAHLKERIAAAEEMAKALEAAHAFIYGDMGDYGVRPDYEDDKALKIIDSALAAWNALK